MRPQLPTAGANVKGRVSVKTKGLKEEWSLVRGLYTWNYQGKVSENVVLKEGWSVS